MSHFDEFNCAMASLEEENYGANKFCVRMSCVHFANRYESEECDSCHDDSNYILSANHTCKSVPSELYFFSYLAKEGRGSCAIRLSRPPKDYDDIMI